MDKFVLYINDIILQVIDIINTLFPKPEMLVEGWLLYSPSDNDPSNSGPSSSRPSEEMSPADNNNNNPLDDDMDIGSIETDSGDAYSEPGYANDPDIMEESSERLIREYQGRADEFLDYQENRVNNLCEKFLENVNFFLEDKTEDRGLLSEDKREEHDKDTTDIVNNWADDFCEGLDGVNRCRDDVLHSIGDDLLDLANRNDDVIKDDVRRSKDNSLNDYNNNNEDNSGNNNDDNSGNNSGNNQSNIDYVLEKSDCEPMSFLDDLD